MIKASDAFKAAIVGSPRKVLIRAVIDISDPDLVYGAVTADSKAPFANDSQLHDKVFDLYPLATLEPNRWLLDGSMHLLPDSMQLPDKQTAFVGDVLSGEDGSYSSPVWVQLSFSNVSILQAFSLFFSKSPLDGVPEEFTVEVLVSGVAYYTKTVTGNNAVSLQFDGFTVYTPDAIKVTVTKWSLPGRRMRIVDIVPGVYEVWSGADVETFSLNQQANFACLALPYGTCTIKLDNLDRRFEPRNKSGIFQSIEERQAIEVAIGIVLEDGTEDFQPVGTYYQFSDGWKTGDNGMTIQWDLVDMIGLIANRTFIAPAELPTTLGGWIGAFVGQLGDNFTRRYHVDPAYANLPVTAAAEDIAGKKVGELLRYACMVTGTFPRADNATGYLTVEPFWSEGNKLTLDNMTTYPVMSANTSIAALIFTLADGVGTQYVVSGNSASSEQTVSIQNPFLHSTADALKAARQILSLYGGNLLETTGRGDPTSEIGDVDTVWLNASSATTGRRMAQSFSFSSGVLQGCQSRLLQADGSYLFEEFALITQSGSWTAPDGVTELRVVIGQGGSGGMKGDDGYIRISDGVQAEPGVDAGYGEDGTPGSGGKIWFGVININPAQTFAVQIGQGGAPSDTYGVPGAEGQHTTFGVYTSADGAVYPYGYTDITNGSSYGRTGVAAPLPGSSDGGQAGSGGMPGAGYTQYYEREVPGGIERGWELIIVQRPTGGKPGTAGGSGFVLVSWDKEAVVA